MSTQFFVSGPAYLWVGLGTGGSPSSPMWNFLGFTEQGLRVSLTSQYEDINTDYAGAMPAAVSFMGEGASISGGFTRYDETVMQKVVSWKGPTGVAGSTAGVNLGTGGVGNDVLGSLVYEEGLSYPVLVFSPYSFKNYYSGTMVPGFWFYNAIHNDTNDRTLGIKRTAPDAGFRCLPVFGTYLNSAFSPNTTPFNAYSLYSNVMPSPLPPTT